MNRISRDEWAVEIARVCAKRSTCLRRSVGCVLLNTRGHVIATGYNGVAAGLPHCNDTIVDDDGKNTFIIHPLACSGAESLSGTNLDACQAIHAEQNALLQCRDVYAIDTCYCTTAPCVTCTKLLMNTSCRRIIFIETYPHAEASKTLWESAGREWCQLIFLLSIWCLCQTSHSEAPLAATTGANAEHNSSNCAGVTTRQALASGLPMNAGVGWVSIPAPSPEQIRWPNLAQFLPAAMPSIASMS